jgi:molecular chaperone DnaK (HSP70)
MAKKRLILGIDLGTTFSLASLRVGAGEFHFFTPEAGGDQLVPSVFLHRKEGENLIGAAAVAEEVYEENRGQVIRHVKRAMNRNYQEGDREPEWFESHGQKFLPAEISGYFLESLKKAAEREFQSKERGDYRDEFEWLGHIYDAVITVPAYFGPTERQATRDAAKFAGFSPDNIHLLDEPVAAALSLNFHQQPGKRLILVIDVGGGTTDITLLKVGKGVENGGFYELGRIGDAGLGGVDIDQEIVKKTIWSTFATNEAANKYYTREEKDSLEDISRQGRLFARAEMEKKKVCREMREQKGVFGQVLYSDKVKGINFVCKFDEKWLRTETEYFVEYCALLCDFLLKNVDRREADKWGPGQGLTWKHVDEVWMVGGTSLMPHLQERIISRLGNKDKLHVAPRPQHAVAEGAAIYAEMIAQNQRLKGLEASRCPCDIGIMARPRERWWMKLSRLIARRPQHSQQSKNQFFPLIRANTRLNDASKRTLKWEARVRPNADGNAYLYIYQRFVGRPPRSEGANANSQRPAKIPYKETLLRVITIPNLPPLNHQVDLDTVYFQITYEPNHTLRVDEVMYRGHKLKSVEVHEGEFNMLFKADTTGSY